MQVSGTTNYREWQAALRDYHKATGKAFIEDALNKRAGRLSWSAYRETPKARLSKYPINATADPDKGGRTEKQKFFYKWATARGLAKKGTGIAAAARREYRRRRQSKGSIAWGFVRAGRVFGGRKIARFTVYAGSTVAASWGRKASIARKAAEFTNHADGADVVAVDAVDRAWLADAADMRIYTERKLREAAEKHSGRRR